MFKLFASLYVFVVVALIGLTSVLEHVLLPQQQQMQEPSMRALGILLTQQPSQQIAKLAIQSGATVQTLPLNGIAFPEAQLNQLKQDGFIILYDATGNPELYLAHAPFDHLIQVSFGEVNELSWQLYSIVFFILMGLALASWTWPLWRDIRALETSVTHLNEDGTLPDIQLRPASNVRNIASALKQLSKQVQGLLQSQRELSGAVAHEFRTPIARLKFALAMADEHTNIDTKGMQNDVQELESLVQEMLDYATLESVSPELSVAEIPVLALCQQLAKKLQNTRPNAAQIQVSGDDIHIMGDGHFIERAVQNIVVNAQKYAKTQIQIAVMANDSNVTITVDDDGPGIAPNLRQKIFEPFFRPDGSRSRAKGGAGLGLAIVKRVQSWHQGNADVQASELGGARFVLSYPLHSKVAS